MILANRHDLKEFIRLGVQLLGNPRNNNGRVLRRYIDQVCDDGGCRVDQTFAHFQHYTPVQLLALVDYAKSVAAEFREFQMVSNGGEFVDTVFQPLAGLVKNSYRLAHPPKEATVKQLRAMVDMIVELCRAMQPFAEDPNATALSSCPDYVYRGLPIRCSDTVWEIGGSDMAGASGVLEWCVDEDDAKQRLALMSQHPRFQHLSAKPWIHAQ